MSTTSPATATLRGRLGAATLQARHRPRATTAAAGATRRENLERAVDPHGRQPRVVRPRRSVMSTPISSATGAYALVERTTLPRGLPLSIDDPVALARVATLLTPATGPTAKRAARTAIHPPPPPPPPPPPGGPGRGSGKVGAALERGRPTARASSGKLRATVSPSWARCQSGSGNRSAGSLPC